MKIVDLLGGKAEYYLNHTCKTIDKQLIHIPGPDMYNPQNEMFRLLRTKRSFSQNETFFFSHPYPPTLPFSA